MSISSRIERVRVEDLLDEPEPTRRTPGQGLSARRRVTGLVLGVLVLPLLTLLLDHLRDSISLESVVLLYLLAVLAVSIVGGVVAALLAATASAFLINFYFVEPLHTLDIARNDQALALVVFIAVAVIVSGAVEIATRRARAAEQSAAHAEMLSALAGGDLDQTETLKAVLEHAREAFGMESVILRARDRASGTWHDVEHAGWAPRGQEAALQFDVPINPQLRLVGRGPALFAEDRRVLQAFAKAAETAYSGRRLAEQARDATALADLDRQRTALFAAVGEDLRAPLSELREGAAALRSRAGDRETLLSTIEDAADRLDALVGNLIDASRLQSGELAVEARSVRLDAAVGAAVLRLGAVPDRIELALPDDLPLLSADPQLLERVLANLLDNALRHAEGPVQVSATAGASSAKVAIIDHGPGRDHEQLFTPGGGGLGLFVARGLTEAMGGALASDHSPGGGLTMRLRLPLARS